MKNDILYATGSFEIGDVFFDDAGEQHTITDVRVCHYMRSGTFQVSYEVDNSGEYVDLIPKRNTYAPGKYSEDANTKKPILRLKSCLMAAEYIQFPAGRD